VAFTLSELLKWTEGRLANESSLSLSPVEIKVEKPSALDKARAGDVAFFFSKTYQADLLKSQPTVLITGEPFVQPLEKSGLPLWKKTAIVACADPYLAMAVISEKFAPQMSQVAHVPSSQTRGKTQVHPTAVVHPEARLGEGVQVGPHCVIEAQCQVGARTILYPGVYLGSGATLGEDSVIFPGVAIYEKCQLGNRVRIHANSVIGADGFGYAARRNAQKEVTGHQKIYHFGKVIIGDDVEVGAGTSIDRGTLDDTVIEKNTKIDNQVQIGHNCKIGEGTVICGKAGLAGSTTVGKYVYIGGLTGIGNQAHIGDRAAVAAVSAISKDVSPGDQAAGNPQRKAGDYFRIQVLLNRMLKDSREK
jgi:UDP-3-O-[3-hydroxymyristoyl] glucosamine N-acyltransferase